MSHSMQSSEAGCRPREASVRARRSERQVPARCLGAMSGRDGRSARS